MPTASLKTIFLTLSRPLVVAVAHVPIVLIAFFACPLWMLLAFKPAALQEVAMHILTGLQRWSTAAITRSCKEIE